MKSATYYLKTTGLYLVSILLFISVVQSAALAQMSNLTKGDLVRIYAPGIQGKSIIGTVYEVSTSAMLVSAEDSSFTIPFASINKLDISKGKKRNAGKGALIGAGLVGLTGGIIGAASYKECNEEGFLACIGYVDKTSLTVVGVLLGTLTGSAVGAIIGSTVESHKWDRIPLKLSAVVAPNHDQALSLNPTISVRLSLKRKP